MQAGRCRREGTKSGKKKWAKKADGGKRRRESERKRGAKREKRKSRRRKRERDEGGSVKFSPIEKPVSFLTGLTVDFLRKMAPKNGFCGSAASGNGFGMHARKAGHGSGFTVSPAAKAVQRTNAQRSSERRAKISSAISPGVREAFTKAIFWAGSASRIFSKTRRYFPRASRSISTHCS